MTAHAEPVSVDAGFDALAYGYANLNGVSSNPAIYAERDLWCAVIAQAFVDIGAIKPSTDIVREEKPEGREFDEAVRWLLRDKADFAYVCEMAGVSPHAIRSAARLFYGQRQMALGAILKE